VTAGAAAAMDGPARPAHRNDPPVRPPPVRRHDALDQTSERWRCGRSGRVSLARATDLLPAALREGVELMKAGGCQVVIEGPTTPSERFPTDPSAPPTWVTRGPGGGEASVSAATRERAVPGGLREWDDRSARRMR